MHRFFLLIGHFVDELVRFDIPQGDRAGVSANGDLGSIRADRRGDEFVAIFFKQMNQCELVQVNQPHRTIGGCGCNDAGLKVHIHRVDLGRMPVDIAVERGLVHDHREQTASDFGPGLVCAFGVDFRETIGFQANQGGQIKAFFLFRCGLGGELAHQV